ncbi:MAG: hypothetical protein ABGF52_11345 [Candidatus Asgardarchaeum sp.]
MAMEEVLDSIRRIIHKWVNTTSRIQSNLSRGATVIPVRNARRFSVGDQVMLKNNSVYETGLVILSIDLITHCITLSTPILNDWTTAENTVLIKTIYEQFVQGIYIGDPDVISRFPAITVNGISRGSEWFTLESTKERFQVEVNVLVQASSHEKGYRFLLNMADTIQLGLKRNIMPLVNDYDVTSLTEDVTAGDTVIRITDRSLVNNYRRIIIEDDSESQENWVTYWYTEDDDPAQTAIKLKDCVPFDFDSDDTSVIVPKRFIYNSWPDNIQYGTIHKGELLKAAKISWFAEEEEIQFLRRDEARLR